MTRLEALTGKNFFKLVSRGNKAILYALRIARKLGKDKLYIQDQGGWITYRQFAWKLKLPVNTIPTDFGIIKPASLKIEKDSILLINSMPGYFALQDMEPIQKIAEKTHSLLINDISGSIGTEQAKIGDIAVCSFGHDKPVNLGRFGLIAAKEQQWLDEIEAIETPKELERLLANFDQRLLFLKKITKKIKKDLDAYDTIHREKEGINVIVKFNTPKVKEEIIKYCDKNKYPYTICPRYIRVNCDAVSIEVKRL